MQIKANLRRQLQLHHHSERYVVLRQDAPRQQRRRGFAYRNRKIGRTLVF